VRDYIETARRFAVHAAFLGERQGQVTDPFGHRWNVAQRLREVPPDEIAAAAARMFGGG
jgi:PhnB protein